MSICPLCQGTGEVEMRPSPIVTQHHLHQIQAMLKGGMTYRQIAAEIGFSAPVVYKHAKRMGLTSRFSKELITSMEARDAMAQADLPKP